MIDEETMSLLQKVYGKFDGCRSVKIEVGVGGRGVISLSSSRVHQARIYPFAYLARVNDILEKILTEPNNADINPLRR